MFFHLLIYETRLVSRWRSRYGYLAAQKKKQNSDSSIDACFKIFNDDQMKLLSGNVRQVKEWSESTKMDSLQIRFACQGGYDKLIERGYPFPSTRTLQRRVADVHFPPGMSFIITFDLQMFIVYQF